MLRVRRGMVASPGRRTLGRAATTRACQCVWRVLELESSERRGWESVDFPGAIGLKRWCARGCFLCPTPAQNGSSHVGLLPRERVVHTSAARERASDPSGKCTAVVVALSAVPIRHWCVRTQVRQRNPCEATRDLQGCGLVLFSCSSGVQSRAS
jgi:hypothetical protein